MNIEWVLAFPVVVAFLGIAVYGRIQHRRRLLEHRPVHQSAPNAPAQPRQKIGARLKPLSESRIERNGLKRGAVAPEFSIEDTQGRLISLRQYRDRRVLLVFSDPRCGPCNELAPYLLRAQENCSAVADIIMVGRGDVAENRHKAETHGFKFPVVVQDRWKLSQKYGIFATPVAFLIGEDGRTAREVAVGFHQIRSLIAEEFNLPVEKKQTAGSHGRSRMFSGLLSRRHAFRTAGCMMAGALFSALGFPKTAAAFACNPGQIECGANCCPGTATCCNPAAGECCPPGRVCCDGICCEPGSGCCGGECCPDELACCNGRCCAPTEECIDGRCQQRVLP